MDSSVFIAWLKGEVVNGVERKEVADQTLGSAKRETFRICISALTLARSPTRRRWETELALADLGTIERRRERTMRRAHAGEKDVCNTGEPTSLQSRGDSDTNPRLFCTVSQTPYAQKVTGSLVEGLPIVDQLEAL